MEVLALSALLSVHCVLHEGQTQCVASFHEDRLSREPQAEVRERERERERCVGGDVSSSCVCM